MLVATGRIRVFEELADWYERQAQPSMRDRFLILAADAALGAGDGREAERLRARLLRVNPHHLLKPYTSFEEASRAPDVQSYLRDLRTNYPAEVAEELLRSLRGGTESARPTTRILPPTAPVIELPDEIPMVHLPEPVVAAPLAEARTSEVARPSAPAIPPRQAMPIPRSARSEPTPPARRAALPPTQPPVSPRPRPRPTGYQDVPTPELGLTEVPPEPIRERGSWVGALLFGMSLTAALALTAFTLARPFLPMQGELRPSPEPHDLSRR